MGVKDWLKERRDAIAEIIGRPKKVLFPDAPTKFIPKESGTGFTPPTLERQADITKSRYYGRGSGGSADIPSPTPTPTPDIPSSEQPPTTEELIEIGGEAKAQVWEMPEGGKSRIVEKHGVVRNIGESEAAFRERQRSLGAGVVGGQPGVLQEFREYKSSLTSEETTPKELRTGTQPIKEVFDFMSKTKSPQQWLGEFLNKKDIDLGKVPGVSMIYDIEKARQETAPFSSSLGFFTKNLWEGVSTSYGDMWAAVKGKTKEFITSKQDSKIVDFFATHKPPQQVAHEFFATHKPPQQYAKEFMLEHKPPQTLLAEQFSVEGLKKTPIVSMITDIEIARQKQYPKMSSREFFFTKLWESTPITSDIQKAYKKSGDESFRKFFTRKLGEGYKQTFTDISEFATYKDTKLFAKARDPNYQYQLSSKIIGSSMGAVGKYQLYFTPHTGGVLFSSPFIEKAIIGKGALKQYVKKHPIETGAFLGFGAFSMYKPIKSLVSVWGKKYIPMSRLTTYDVLTGKKTFPTSFKSHLKLFRESPYRLPGETQLGVWHATGKELPSMTLTTAGKSELAGLYGAYGVSPHFLRVSGESGYKLFGSSFSLKSPAILRITPKGIIGATAKRIKPGKVGAFQWVDDVSKGYAYVPQVKAEVEAIIPQGTELIKTGAKYFTSYKGEPIPIFQYKTTGGDILNTIGRVSASSTLKQISNAYSSIGGGKKYIFSPSSVSRALLGYSGVSKPISYKPSKVSYRVSMKSMLSNLKPSKVSYKTSSISYKPSVKVSGVSYGKSYKPSKASAYFPKQPKPLALLPPLKMGTQAKLALFGRKYHYQPGIAALGLKGTKYEQYFKMKKLPKLSVTGITTRGLTPKGVKWGKGVDITKAPTIKTIKPKVKDMI